jgi:prophage antirepressor-like protein
MEEVMKQIKKSEFIHKKNMRQQDKVYSKVMRDWNDVLANQTKSCIGVFDLIFENKKIITLNLEGETWFKGSDIGKILDYKDSNQAIRDHIRNANKIKYSKIGSVSSTGQKKYEKNGGDYKSRQKKIAHNAIFINEEGVNQLILKSEKPEANKFKSWICSKVIPAIRTTGTYTNEDFKPTKFIKDGIPVFTKNTLLNNPQVIEYFNKPTTTFPDATMINVLLDKSDSIPISYFFKKHVLYCYITSITNMFDERLILKIGYTADPEERLQSLIRNYQCRFRLIAIKEINSQQDEKSFHTLIRSNYPELQYYIKVGDKGKDELYYFDPKLMKLFYSYVVSKPVKTTENDVLVAKYNAEISKYNAIKAKYDYQRTMVSK